MSAMVGNALYAIVCCIWGAVILLIVARMWWRG
jgi:uncharacterized membrane protein YeaQ/YmgE (transglycosylase-associated protein family)